MTPDSRRSTLAIVAVVTLVVGMLVAGGAAGQTATETPPDAATETPEATEAGTETTEAATETTDTPTATPGTGTPMETTTVSYDQDSSFLRVAHVAPDAGAVDVFVDGDRVLSDVQFADVSDYLTLAAGQHDVRITPAGENESAIFDGNVTLDPRTTMTLFAAGEVAENASEPFTPILYEDDPFRPAGDEAAISVAHVSPDAPTVDVTADNGSVLLADDLTFGNASQYVTVPAGNHTIEIRPATETNDAPAVATTNVSLSGGTAYSAIAAGYVDGFDSTLEERFRVELVQDATKTIHLPSAEDDETGTEEPTAGTTTETAGEGTETVDDDTGTEVAGSATVAASVTAHGTSHVTPRYGARSRSPPPASGRRRRRRGAPPGSP